MSLFLLILIAALVVFVAKGVIIVQQAEVVIVERLGKYHRTHCDNCDSTIETKEPVEVCPKCGSDKVTFGVFDRIEFLLQLLSFSFLCYIEVVLLHDLLQLVQQ